MIDVQDKHLQLPFGHIEARWYRLHAAQDTRTDDTPTIVLLHEGLGCIAMWKDFPAHLCTATGYNVFTYSRHGYGGSAPCALPRPTHYLNHEAENILPHILQAAGIRAHILYGHSDGGSIALAYASMRPHGLRALVVEAPHTFCEDLSVQGIKATLKYWKSGNLKDKLMKYHGANVDTAFHGWCDTWLSTAFRDWSIQHLLPCIQVPVLAIQGADDHYGSLKHIEDIAACCAARTLILADTGHAPHKEKTDAVLAACTPFMHSAASHRHPPT
jgi:pimeloyl-ACP methyl ester carboxylesterase